MKKLPSKAQRTFKLPWEKDPDDLEANYRRPVPRRELVRLYLKVAAAVGAGVWFKFAIEDRSREGAKLAVAVGFALMCAGLIDLIYLRRYEIEQIFLTTRAQQIAVRWLVLAGGAVLLIGGGLAYAS